MGGVQNYETYLVSGSNIFAITTVNSIQARKPNDFRIASIIAKNCTEGLPSEKNISLDESKSKITLTSWIAWIRSYMEYKGMYNAFFVYDISKNQSLPPR